MGGYIVKYYGDDFETYTLGALKGQTDITKVEVWDEHVPPNQVMIKSDIIYSGAKSCWMKYDVVSGAGCGLIWYNMIHTGKKEYIIPLYLVRCWGEVESATEIFATKSIHVNVRCGINSSGNFWVANGDTVVVLGAYGTGSWRVIKMIVDWDTLKFDVFLDNTLVAHDYSCQQVFYSGYADNSFFIISDYNDFYIDNITVNAEYMGVLEAVTNAMVSTINTELQSISTSFKVRAGYPHESASIPYSVYVNIIDMGHEEFGQGQRYKTNIIQKRKLLVRISVYTPKSADTTLFSDGIGTSSEQLYLDRICDSIQRCLMRYRNLNNDNVCDTTLRGVSPLLFDENLNSFNKTMSYDIEYEELFEK